MGYRVVFLKLTDCFRVDARKGWERDLDVDIGAVVYVCVKFINYIGGEMLNSGRIDKFESEFLESQLSEGQSSGWGIHLYNPMDCNGSATNRGRFEFRNAYRKDRSGVEGWPTLLQGIRFQSYRICVPLSLWCRSNSLLAEAIYHHSGA